MKKYKNAFRELIINQSNAIISSCLKRTPAYLFFFRLFRRPILIQLILFEAREFAVNDIFQLSIRHLL